MRTDQILRISRLITEASRRADEGVERLKSLEKEKDAIEAAVALQHQSMLELMLELRGECIAWDGGFVKKSATDNGEKPKEQSSSSPRRSAQRWASEED